MTTKYHGNEMSTNMEEYDGGSHHMTNNKQKNGSNEHRRGVEKGWKHLHGVKSFFFSGSYFGNRSFFRCGNWRFVNFEMRI